MTHYSDVPCSQRQTSKLVWNFRCLFSRIMVPVIEQCWVSTRWDIDLSQVRLSFKYSFESSTLYYNHYKQIHFYILDFREVAHFESHQCNLLWFHILSCCFCVLGRPTFQSGEKLAACCKAVKAWLPEVNMLN